MLGRLYIRIRPGVYIPEGEQYKPCDYKLGRYLVREYFPIRSERAAAEATAEDLQINGVKAFYADTLQIDFIKKRFERRVGKPPDPPVELIGKAVNSYLLRLRHSTRAGQIRPINFPFTTWKLVYLMDDESKLPTKKGYSNGHGGGSSTVSWIILNRDIWETMHKLPPDYSPPPWDSVLLDASLELPNVGPALTLASMALEVFIANLLDKIAASKRFSRPLWKWITDRGHFTKDPSTGERFDVLLKELTGHSLKDEAKLWEIFQNLKEARNSFVHEGIATIGKKPVTAATAQELVAGASLVIAKVREWTPPKLQWPEFRHDIKLGIGMRIN
jgi:hypothetical protein